MMNAKNETYFETMKAMIELANPKEAVLLLASMNTQNIDEHFWDDLLSDTAESIGITVCDLLELINRVTSIITDDDFKNYAEIKTAMDAMASDESEDCYFDDSEIVTDYMPYGELYMEDDPAWAD